MKFSYWASVAFIVLAAGAAGYAMAEAASTKPRVEPGDIAGEGFQGAFHAHEPTYAVLGGGDQFGAKFQVGFKLRFWDHTFFSYTQTSVWDLYYESSPFRDSSYRPSFFIIGPASSSMCRSSRAMEKRCSNTTLRETPASGSGSPQRGTTGPNRSRDDAPSISTGSEIGSRACPRARRY